MGIPKLTSFVNDYFAYWEPRRVRGKLVVDGGNVLHSLHTAEWSNGGQYPEFRVKVRDFYSCLQRSGITPIVIFDGVDYEEQKTDTLMRRKQEWVDFIHKRVTTNFTRPRSCYGHILPPLCGEVYRMVLHGLGIQFYVADGEADIVIARVANYYSCPVLSLDSDFFVFHLVGGYIPFNNFHWQSSVVTAEVYHQESFAAQLKFQDSNLFFAIPAIVGNDFIPSCNPSYIREIINSVPNGGSIKNHIQPICLFLSQFSSLEEYIASEFGGRKQEQRCHEVMQWYSVPTSLSCEELVEKTALTHCNGSRLPQWLIELFHRGHLPSAPIKAAVIGKVLFRMIADNFQKDSSIVAGQVVRKHMYALLGCEQAVEVFRHGICISGVKVSSTKLKGKYSTVTVSSLQYLPHHERQSLFYTIMQCDEWAVSQLAGPYHDWKFVVATASLWARTTSVPESIVKALLLCFMICSGLHDGKLRSLRRTCRVPVAFRQSQKWLDVLHSFVEWQVIHHTAWTLNALLMEPMSVFSPAFLYDGEIAMYLASAANIDQLVPAFNDIDTKLYNRLKHIVLSASFAVPPVMSTPSYERARGLEASGNFRCDHATNSAIGGIKIRAETKKIEPADKKATEQEGIQRNQNRAKEKVVESSPPHKVHQPAAYISDPVTEEPKQEETEERLESLVGHPGHAEPFEKQEKSKSVPQESSSTILHHPPQVKPAAQNTMPKRKRPRHKNTATHAGNSDAMQTSKKQIETAQKSQTPELQSATNVQVLDSPRKVSSCTVAMPRQACERLSTAPTSQSGGSGATTQTNKKQIITAQKHQTPKLQNETEQEGIPQHSDKHSSPQDKVSGPPHKSHQPRTELQNRVKSGDRLEPVARCPEQVESSKEQEKSKSVFQVSSQSAAAASQVRPAQNTRPKRKRPRHKNTATHAGDSGAMQTSKKQTETAQRSQTPKLQSATNVQVVDSPMTSRTVAMPRQACERLSTAPTMPRQACERLSTAPTPSTKAGAQYVQERPTTIKKVGQKQTTKQTNDHSKTRTGTTTCDDHRSHAQARMADTPKKEIQIAKRQETAVPTRDGAQRLPATQTAPKAPQALQSAGGAAAQRLVSGSGGEEVKPKRRRQRMRHRTRMAVPKEELAKKAPTQ